jgi:creatinine amidohydrolase
MSESTDTGMQSTDDPALEVQWRRLRADQLREKAKLDAIVIVPVGAMEQHGPHLPVEVDSLLAETIALKTARLMVKTTPVVVLPCLWTGISEHHMSFGGTISLKFPTFLALLTDVCHSLVRHGFKRIVLLNGHGGNDNGLRVIADELAYTLKVSVVQFTYWHAAEQPIARLLDRQTKLLHACEAETSMLMALRPELVVADQFVAAEVPCTKHTEELVGPGIYRWRSLAAMASSGVVGYPTAASAKKGEQLLAAIGADLAEKLVSKGLWAQTWQ